MCYGLDAIAVDTVKAPVWFCALLNMQNQQLLRAGEIITLLKKKRQMKLKAIEATVTGLPIELGYL